MSLIKSSEELRRLPLGKAVSIAAICGLGELYFWLCVLATGFMCLRFLADTTEPNDLRKARVPFLIIGSCSILFYSYIGLFHADLFIADNGDSIFLLDAGVDSHALALISVYVSLAMVCMIIGALPAFVIIAPAAAIFYGAWSWILRRAGREPRISKQLSLLCFGGSVTLRTRGCRGS